MAEYEFQCDGCSGYAIREEPMSASHTPPVCSTCNIPMRRIFGSAFHCDEIRGRKYFHPGLKQEVQGHGKYFDIGMGQWINSKSDRWKKMKKLGLQEWGSPQV